MGSRLDPRASSGGLGLIAAAQVCAGHAWAARSPECDRKIAGRCM